MFEETWEIRCSSGSKPAVSAKLRENLPCSMAARLSMSVKMASMFTCRICANTAKGIQSAVTASISMESYTYASSATWHSSYRKRMSRVTDQIACSSLRIRDSITFPGMVSSKIKRRVRSLGLRSSARRWASSKAKLMSVLKTSQLALWATKRLHNFTMLFRRERTNLSSTLPSWTLMKRSQL